MKERVLKSKLWNSELWFKPIRGCTQGGVLPPIMWCLVVDSFLTRLNTSGFYAQEYADDIAQDNFWLAQTCNGPSETRCRESTHTCSYRNKGSYTILQKLARLTHIDYIMELIGSLTEQGSLEDGQTQERNIHIRKCPKYICQ